MNWKFHENIIIRRSNLILASNYIEFGKYAIQIYSILLNVIEYVKCLQKTPKGEYRQLLLAYRDLLFSSKVLLHDHINIGVN